MDEKIVLGVIIVFAVSAMLFIGTGVTGFAVADSSSHDVQKDSSNVYTGVILLFTLMLFLLTIYGDYITNENHKHD